MHNCSESAQPQHQFHRRHCLEALVSIHLSSQVKVKHVHVSPCFDCNAIPIPLTPRHGLSSGGNKYVNLWGENCKYKITEFIPVTLYFLFKLHKMHSIRNNWRRKRKCIWTCKVLIHMYVTNTFSCCPIKQFSTCFFLFRFSVHFQSSRVY